MRKHKYTNLLALLHICNCCLIYSLTQRKSALTTSYYVCFFLDNLHPYQQLFTHVGTFSLEAVDKLFCSRTQHGESAGGVFRNSNPLNLSLTLYLINQADLCTLPCIKIYKPPVLYRERFGSVVEFFTRDRGAAGSSLTSVTVLWSLSKTHLS